MIGPDDPGFEVLRPDGTGRFVIVCDHASNRIPSELGQLGLTPSELDRHIAWDIGAADVARALSDMFDAPAILCATSRLVIDCNRQLDAPSLIPERSDGTSIPGNLNLSEDARRTRIARWFHPYHAAIESVLDTRVAPFVLSIHSMTDCLAGVVRPWKISLSSFDDRSMVEPALENLRRSVASPVGDNQPYDLDPKVDYTIPFHAMRRNLRYLQVEFRQDEISDARGQTDWAQRFADALTGVGDY